MATLVKSTLKREALLSDDGNYRYVLHNSWDESKDNLAVIMLNPSKADELKLDKTVMNLNNFAVDNDFGSLTIVNLYAFMATEPKDLKYRNDYYERDNDEHIVTVANYADTIIVAWGSDSKKYVSRKREVEALLIPYAEKLKCFVDKQGRMPRHPRDLSEEWDIVNYEFIF